jgi:hypothetical protein
MKKSLVIDYYGSTYKVAAALDISQPSVVGWPDPIPEGSAARIHVMTDGALVYDPDYYRGLRAGSGRSQQKLNRGKQKSQSENCVGGG